MNDNEVYQQWIRQRQATELPPGFIAQVTATWESETALNEDTQCVGPIKHTKRHWQHPLAIAVTLLVASVLGFARIGLTLLIGIQSH